MVLKRIISIITALMMFMATMPYTVFAYADKTTDNEAIANDSSSEMVQELYEEEDLGDAPTDYINTRVDITSENIVPNQYIAPNGAQKCGKNTTWTLENGVLTISGTGEMNDYSGDEYAPWCDICYEIKEVIVEDGVTKIGESAFYDAYNLEKVVLADSVKKLGYGAFANCTSLNEFIANGLTEIEDYAFNKTALAEYTVPAGVENIGYLAFMGTPIENYYVASGNKVFSAKDGVLYEDSGKTLVMYPSGNKNEVFEIPSTVTKVAEGAFLTNCNLRSIKIPETVKSLGESAFQMCKSLKSIVIPNSIKEVGNFTFYECTALEELTFGNGLKSTSYLMFENCTSLKSIDFGSGLEEIYARTFSYCVSLENVVIPVNVKTIGNGAFGECISLETVVIEGITDCIPYQTFFNCGSLENVTINEGVEYIYTQSFYGCDALAEINLPDSVKYIASEAFPTTTVLNNLNPKLEHFGINGYRMVQNIYLKVQEKYSAAYNVLNFVNRERAKVGAEPLVMNESLMESAMLRAAECTVMFSHTRPIGEDCFSSNELMYGENIAYGSTTAKGVMNQWMNSAGHKANILSEEYTTIGIGCVVHDGGYYWVQCFGKGKDTTNCDKLEDVTKEKMVSFTIDPIEDEDNLVIKPRMVVENAKLKLNGSTTARIYVESAKCNNKEIAWSSNNSKVITVTSGGKIKAVGYGTAKVTAKMKHFTLSKKITVTCPGHKYKKTTTKATYRNDGKIIKKCSVCKNTITTKIYAPKTVKLSYTLTTYNGKTKKPTVKVINSKGNVVSSKNYTVTYQKGRTKVGEYKVTVKFKNNYKGKVVRSFKIRPKATTILSVTAKKDNIKVKWKKQTVQTSGYEICYSTSKTFNNSKKVLVSSNKKVSKSINGLESGRRYFVKIRTYKKVSGIKYYSKWGAVKSVTVQ